MDETSLIGKRFGRLVVLRFVSDDHHKNSKWLCRCDCGNETIVYRYSLVTGNTKSCGCWKKEKAILDNTTHGHYHSRLYKIWRGMKNRCYNPKVRSYADYGSKGIIICQEWNDSFEAFYNWAMSSGYDEDAPFMECTIDRIDVNGNYEPSNCRWVDKKIQANNKSNNFYITFNNQRKTACEWSDIYGVPSKTIKRRIKDGWNVETALTLPAVIGRNQKGQEARRVGGGYDS